MNAKEVERAREKLADLKEERSKAVGAREPLMAQLKEEFDCESIEDVNEELGALQDEIEAKDALISEKSVKLKALLEDC